jgi:hypothetical protein
MVRNIVRLPGVQRCGQSQFVSIVWKRSKGLRTRSALVAVAALLLTTSLPLFLFTSHASASTMGPSSPTLSATAAGAGTVNWTNPTNIYSANSVYATAAIASTAISYNLLATGYGFTIPNTATINGVSVSVTKFATTSANNAIQDQAVSLVIGGATAGSNLGTTTTWPSANTAVAYGGVTNTWGNSLTPAIVNASNFGVAVAAKNVHASGSSASLTADVDYISLTVSYTINSTYNQASYRWYQDAAATSPIAAQNTAITSTSAPFYLRMLLGVGAAPLAASGQYFQLMEAQLTSGSCTSSLTYSVVTATSPIAFSTATGTDGSAITASANDPTDGANTVVAQDYLTSNTSFTNNQAAIAVGQDGEWNAALYNHGATAGTSWCFEVQKSNGVALDTYTQFPQLTTPPTSLDQAGYRWFQNSNVAPPLFPVSEDLGPGTSPVNASTTAIDPTGGYMYVAGMDDKAGGSEWRIEKRLLTTGAFVTAFGTSGAISEHISTSDDAANAISIDTAGGYMYVAGYDRNAAGSTYEWRIEKRLLTTGAFVTAFGTSGAISETISPNGDKLNAIAIDPTGGYMYVAGYDNNTAGSTSEWRIEKRLLTTGAFVTAFGTSGAISEHISTSTTGEDQAHAIAIDPTGGYMYVAGYDNNTAGSTSEWRIEKRLLTTGAFVTAFGTSGAISEHISTSTTGRDQAHAIAIDTAGGYMYVAGNDINTANNVEWRIESRNLTSGGPVAPPVTPIASQNTSTNQFHPGDTVRLRLLIGIGGSPVALNGQGYKLQVAGVNGVCSNSLNYADVTASSGPVQYYANSNLTDGMAMSASPNDPTDGSNVIAPQSYIQSNTKFINNQTAITPTQDGEWDIALQINQANGFGGYCFRVVTAAGALLTSYTNFPQLGVHPNADTILNHGQTVINGVRGPIDILKP